VVNNEEGTLSRGDKLAPLRTLLDSAGLRTQGALLAIQGHDVALCRPWLEQAPVLRAGDRLWEDRGCLDGALLSYVKRQRQVDGIMPRKANRLATQEAIHLAELAHAWPAHPSRPEQSMTLVRGGEPRWTECEVPRHAWVIRFWKTKKKRTAHLVVGTTDLELSAPWIVRHDEERPEIAHDDEQRTSGGWLLQKRSATR